MTDKHNTKYNTLVSEQPYIHARWSLFTFPGQNEPRPGYRGSIPGRLASLIGLLLKLKSAEIEIVTVNNIVCSNIVLSKESFYKLHYKQ